VEDSSCIASLEQCRPAPAMAKGGRVRFSVTHLILAAAQGFPSMAGKNVTVANNHKPPVMRAPCGTH
jgi:hypothetical protein